MGQGRIRIGTSGWSYNHWKGPFYPPETTSREMLSFYCGQFDAVEINNSFYRLPKADQFEQWKEASPPGFLFCVKASRYITHQKKLKDPDSGLANLYAAAEGLGEKLGAILFQLPDGWSFNEERFAAFLETLSADHTHAFELRDHSWHNERVYGILERHRCAFCIFDLAGFRSPILAAGSTVYVRLHGSGKAYEGSYTPQGLRVWANRFLAWAKEGRMVYCFFDNDQQGFAPRNAMRIGEYINK